MVQLLTASRIVVTMPGYGHSGSFKLNVDETLGASEDEVNRNNTPCLSLINVLPMKKQRWFAKTGSGQTEGKLRYETFFNVRTRPRLRRTTRMIVVMMITMTTMRG